MKKSESIKNLAIALLKFHGEVGKISKDAKNPFFKSNYASLSNIQDGIREPLQNAGLVYSQMPVFENELTTLLIHAASGEYLESTYIMTPIKPDPQAKGSAISYARRYALAAVLGLNVDDDDGNKASAKNTPQAKPQAKKKAVTYEVRQMTQDVFKAWKGGTLYTHTDGKTPILFHQKVGYKLNEDWVAAIKGSAKYKE